MTLLEQNRACIERYYASLARVIARTPATPSSIFELNTSARTHYTQQVLDGALECAPMPFSAVIKTVAMGQRTPVAEMVSDSMASPPLA